MKKLVRLIGILVFLGVLFSCENEEVDLDPIENQIYFKSSFQTPDSTGTFEAVEMGFIIKKDRFELFGQDQKGSLIQFTLNNIDKVDFDLNETNPVHVEWVTDSLGTISYGIHQETDTGTLKISSIDSLQKKASGTFSFNVSAIDSVTASPDSVYISKTIHFTKGSFSNIPVLFF